MIKECTTEHITEYGKIYATAFYLNLTLENLPNLDGMDLFFQDYQKKGLLIELFLFQK